MKTQIYSSHNQDSIIQTTSQENNQYLIKLKKSKWDIVKVKKKESIEDNSKLKNHNKEQ